MYTWLDFISKVIAALAWPVAVIVIALVFKSRIATLLGKIKHAKGAGMEVDFAEDVERLAEKVPELTAETARFSKGYDVGSLVLHPAKVAAPAGSRPKEMMLSSWKGLEEAVYEYAEKAGMLRGEAASKPNFDDTVLALLYHEPKLTKMLGVVQDLHDLREKLLESKDWEPTRSDAVYFMGTANAATDYLHALMHDAGIK